MLWLLKACSELGKALIDYKKYSETHFASRGYRVQSLRLDQARENVKEEVASFCRQQGIHDGFLAKMILIHSHLTHRKATVLQRESSKNTGLVHAY